MVRILFCLTVVAFLFVPTAANAQIMIFGSPPPEPDSYTVELGPWIYRGRMVHRDARFSGKGPSGIASTREESRRYIVEGDRNYNRAVDRDGSPGHGVVISTTVGYPALVPVVVPVQRYYYVAPRPVYMYEHIYVLP